ncbi:UNVERIFIED_CONTAM: hypothetical protein FKN15_072628 [Acipenser sinensis]
MLQCSVKAREASQQLAKVWPSKPFQPRRPQERQWCRALPQQQAQPRGSKIGPVGVSAHSQPAFARSQRGGWHPRGGGRVNPRLQDRSAEGGTQEEVADRALVALARPLVSERSLSSPEKPRRLLTHPYTVPQLLFWQQCTNDIWVRKTIFTGKPGSVCALAEGILPQHSFSIQLHGALDPGQKGADLGVDHRVVLLGTAVPPGDQAMHLVIADQGAPRVTLRVRDTKKTY